jgi:hypothetical protein
VITNRVAATCAVCGKYVPVRTGVSVGEIGDRKFRHQECGDYVAAADTRGAARRVDRRWDTEVGLGARLAAIPRPGLAAVGGAVAVVLGVALLFVAGGDDNSADPVVPASGTSTTAEVEVLGQTVTSIGETTTTIAGATTTAELPGVVPPPGSPTTRPRGRTTAPPGSPTATADDPGPSTPGSPVTTSGSPGTTSSPGSPTTTRPPTTTVRPPTTTQPPITTTPPPTTPPPTTPPPTTEPPTTPPPTTEPPTTPPPTTEPPTTPPPTTEPPTTPPPSLGGLIGDLLDDLL